MLKRLSPMVEMPANITLFPNARHRLNMFLESSGILSFYAGLVLPLVLVLPMVLVLVAVSSGGIRAWLDFVCVAGRCTHPNSCCQLLNVAQLLALIWGHCHRYKTESGAFCHVHWSRGIRCAFFEYSASSVWVWVSAVFLSLFLLLFFFFLAALSECVHQHLDSREIHSRLVII